MHQEKDGSRRSLQREHDLHDVKISNFVASVFLGQISF